MSQTPFAPFLRSEIEQTIVDRFAEQASRYAHRTAVLTPYEEWSYADLDARSNTVAAAIVGRCGPGRAPVALCLDQGAQLVAAILGVLKAGKFYVPLDPADLPARQSATLAASGAALLATDEINDDRARRLHDRPPVVWNVDSAPPGPGTTRPEVPVSKNDPAYVFFTSGTTGTPKGVIDAHRNVLHNIFRYTNALQITPDDRLTLIQSPSFSGTVSSLFGALLNGAAVLPYDFRRHGFRRLAEWLRQSQATIYHSVPSMLRGVAAAGGPFPAVRVVRLEGDGATRADYDLFCRTFGDDCTLAHGLGATETGLSCQFQATRDAGWHGDRLPIGSPLPDIELRIVDEAGVAVPDGTTGEIEISSEFLATGYWRDPSLTNRRFVAVDDDPTRRRYRTGDLGVIRVDRRVYHLGRVDQEHKINGQWLSTLEVEVALAGLGAFRDVLVTTWRDEAGEARLVAYVVVTEGVSVDPVSWREALADRLPSHMLPNFFVAVDAFPLTEHGKIDRSALPPPTSAERHPDGVPRSAEERNMVAIWEEILNVRPVGIRDNFFNLGGDSLRAALLTSRVEQAFGPALAPTALLSAPTIERFMKELQAPAASPRSDDPMLVFRAHGSRPPVFFVDWPDGGGWQLSGLISRLGEDQPCYGFVSGGIPEPWPPGTTIEQMASAIVRSIRAVQPHGSLALVGNCYGSVIALEAARQLRGDEPVRLLVMLDISPKDFPTLVSPDVMARFRRNETRERWARRRAELVAGGWLTSIGVVTARARRRCARVGATLMRALTGRLEHRRGGPVDRHAARERAARAHRPTPHVGDVLCLVSENAMRAVAADESSFSRLGTSVTVHLLPGDDLFVAPAIDQAATLLRHALRSHDSNMLDKVGGRAPG